MALAAMLQIGKTLDNEAFQKRVIPAVSKLFSSTDRSMRRSLLENIEVYGQHMDQVREIQQFESLNETGNLSIGILTDLLQYF